MGACISNQRRGTVLTAIKSKPKQQVLSQEQSMLLDMWNEKHIQILKEQFNEAAGKKAVLDYNGFLKVFDNGISILQVFGPTISKQAFRLFDSSRLGSIIFIDFCCALSIICLGSTNEKIRFLFDLFDLDRDSLLNKKELTKLLHQLATIWIENKVQKQAWVDLHLQHFFDQELVNFYQFKVWTEQSLDVYKVLQVFELVPSPWREHELILEILNSYERKHGDTMYALSYHWWDYWKEYTEKHASTAEVELFLDRMRDSVSKHPTMPESLKALMLDDKGKVEFKKDQWDQEDLQQSFSTRQQLTLKRSSLQQTMLLNNTMKRQLSVKQDTNPEDHVDTDVADSTQLPRRSILSNQSKLKAFNLNLSLQRDYKPVSRNDEDHKSETSAHQLKSILTNTPKSQIKKQIKRPKSNNSSYLVKSNMQIQNYGNRPNAIDNSDIEGEHPGQLQPNLIMYRDFVTLPEQAWNLLTHWYGISQTSPVFARKVLIHNSVASMELYPPRILCVLADRDGKPVPDSQKALFVSTSLTIGEVHLKICELFNYISTRDTRLWVKQNDGLNDWTLVEPKIHVQDGAVFMVEVKFYGNQWPMDEKAGHKRQWTQFEIGDRLDVQDQDTWKVGCIDKVNKDTIKVHLVNENWKHDLTIRKDSGLLAQFGQHTFKLHFTKKQWSTQVLGIKNIGNTCYMNACLQTLLHTPLYSNYFTTPAFKSQIKKEDSICEAFSQLVHKSLSSVIEPTQFKKVVNTTLPLFYGNQQHDVAEFYNLLLDKMNEEMNRAGKQETAEKPKKVEVIQVSETGEVGGTLEVANKLLEEMKQRELNLITKLEMQQRAISEAKQNVYNEFFKEGRIPSIEKTESFNPNISETEAKARAAWFQSLRVTNSPVTDLFVGQQATEITCLHCSNKHFTFENFYSLPIPLPVTSSTVFYVNYVRHQTKSQKHSEIIQYGFQIKKNQKLQFLVDLLVQVQGQVNFVVCEVANSKIYRVQEDYSMPIFLISKRTNHLTFFEMVDRQPTQQPKPKPSSLTFTSFDEVNAGQIVDAADQHSKWYIALIIDKEPQTENTPARVLIHYYQLNSKLDEWFEESPETLRRLKPLGASGCAQSLDDFMIKMLLQHRRNDKVFGQPYCLNIPNWLTWKGFYDEVYYQMKRHIKEDDIATEVDMPTPLSQIVLDRKPAYRTGMIKVKEKSVIHKIELDTNPKYFQIKVFDAESGLCVFCALKQKCKQDHAVCSNGCPVQSQSEELVKYTFTMYKYLQIVIDWNESPTNQPYYQDPPMTQTPSYISFKKQEKESSLAIPLTTCLDLYSKKEKIEGYHCDTCNSNTTAVIKPMISHLPDVLVLHLKRFNFEQGYLDKIEDLVTFPLLGLEMSPYLSKGQHHNTQYNLYAVVNHHIYQTGGHYTAALQVTDQNEAVWVLTNDHQVTQISAADLVNKDAYMLFYKRQELTPSNILKLTHQL